jgi:hypothetical protein
MLRIILLELSVSIILFVGCDNYSHNSYVNTNPANYISVTMIQSVGGSNIDWGSGIITTDNNGYLATGTTGSYGLDSNSLYLTYVDSNGVVDWSRVYGGYGNDHGQAIIQVSSGDIFVGGATSSFQLSSGVRWDHAVHPFIEWDYNFYLIKMNVDGDTYWEKVYGDSSSLEWCTSIATSPDGFALAGYNGNNNFDDPGENNEFFVVKTDLDGNMVWQNSYGTPNQDQAHSIVATADGGFIVGGFTYEEDTNIGSPYLIKINSGGNLIWENTYGNPGVDQRIYAMISTSDGGYAATGYSRIIVDDEPSISSLYVIKINTEGVVLWENMYPQSRLTTGLSIIEDSRGSLIISGETAENGNVNITKLNSNGSLFWSQNTIVPGSGKSLAQIAGGYVLTGSSFHPLSPTITDMLILEIIEDLTNIEL